MENIIFMYTYNVSLSSLCFATDEDGCAVEIFLQHFV